MTTSQFTAGVVRRSATFCGLKRIFRCEGNQLEQNYRSQQILSAASHMIAVNQGRLGKTLDRSRAANRSGSTLCGMASPSAVRR